MEEKIVFFREKNADSIKVKLRKIPKKEDLEILLLEKLKDKANHIKTIEDVKLRKDYLVSKNKWEKANDLPEFEVKRFLVKRLSVDIFQLILDICKVYNFKLDFVCGKTLKNTEDNIRKELIDCIEIFKNNKNENVINLMYNLLLSYINIFGFDIIDIDKLRQEVEDKEGNYYKGKIVLN